MQPTRLYAGSVVFSPGQSISNLQEGEVTTTQASAIVTRCGEDVTDEYAENAFHWTRDSGNIEADTVWNAAHAGMKSITFAAADIDGM